MQLFVRICRRRFFHLCALLSCIPPVSTFVRNDASEFSLMPHFPGFCLLTRCLSKYTHARARRCRVRSLFVLSAITTANRSSAVSHLRFYGWHICCLPEVCISDSLRASARRNVYKTTPTYHRLLHC